MITWEKARKLLDAKGINTNYMKQHKLIGYATYKRLMLDEPINTKILDRLCNVLDCEPMDLMSYTPDNSKGA
jgi:DNA-binding Xre family transcriptional regulator